MGNFRFFNLQHESPQQTTRKLFGNAGLAGGTSIICMNPTDVVKTQCQTATGKPSIIGITKQIWAREGLRGFWRGTEPNVARCFIGNACEIGCYDQFKVSLTTFGVPDGPLSHLGASAGAGILQSVYVSARRLSANLSNYSNPSMPFTTTILHARHFRFSSSRLHGGIATRPQI